MNIISHLNDCELIKTGDDQADQHSLTYLSDKMVTRWKRTLKDEPTKIEQFEKEGRAC